MYYKYISILFYIDIRTIYMYNEYVLIVHIMINYIK